MPLLLNVLRNTELGPEYRRLRIKAMECAGLIAIAVGRDTFRPDAGLMVECLLKLQSECFSDVTLLPLFVIPFIFANPST
jgi:importin-5